MNLYLHLISTFCGCLSQGVRHSLGSLIRGGCCGNRLPPGTATFGSHGLYGGGTLSRLKHGWRLFSKRMLEIFGCVSFDNFVEFVACKLGMVF